MFVEVVPAAEQLDLVELDDETEVLSGFPHLLVDDLFFNTEVNNSDIILHSFDFLVRNIVELSKSFHTLLEKKSCFATS